MTKILAWIAFGCIFGGLAMILAANLFRTPKHPHPFYHPLFLGHLGWKKEWWTKPGYVLQRIGPIIMGIGFLVSAVSCFMRW